MKVAEAPRFALEKNQRLSSSMLWRLQRRFYSEQTIDAWRQSIVPHYVTSNTFIAQAYAKLVFGYLRDVLRDGSHDPQAPLYVLELGAGSGRFSYHFLTYFFSMLAQSVHSETRVTFVMSDFSEKNLRFWRQHPSLQAFVAQGQLDFALVDLSQQKDIMLLHSGTVLAAGQISNPLVVLANYVFDSIEQDAFYVEDGVLYESLVSLHSANAESDPDDISLLERVQADFVNVPVQGSAYYAEPALNRLLDFYRQTVPAAHVLLPTQALRYLDHLRHISNNRLLLISADKGISREVDVAAASAPEIATHGSISLMVNYHAIGRYVQEQGGRVLMPPHRQHSLQFCVMLFDERLAAPTPSLHLYAETGQAFEDHLCRINPDDFFVLKRFIQGNAEHLSLAQLLAYLRMSGWDAANFWGCYEAFMRHAATLEGPLRHEIASMVESVWNVYYPLGEERDLAFALASLLYEIDHYAEAITYLEHSLRLYGDDAGTLYNLAMCHAQLAQLPASAQCIDAALRIDPHYEPALAWQESTQLRLEPRLSVQAG
ncbi:tetratricopeptide repeat protein [Herbaspirillum rhizosphaerae]|uniref:tetratricopeptide repeat protein n=1 Tax=Herbaspirillum rhizosphaerae TaxID=346179 RepID=UPI00067ACE4E|nr:tetratricopeptide repeat protein [Herbaspirillum rhizosphaerae]